MLFLMGSGTPAGIDFAPLTEALTTGITVSNVMSVLATGIGAGLTFYLMWFGVRKLLRVFLGAMSKGKIRV